MQVAVVENRIDYYETRAILTNKAMPISLCDSYSVLYDYLRTLNIQNRDVKYSRNAIKL